MFCVFVFCFLFLFFFFFIIIFFHWPLEFFFKIMTEARKLRRNRSHCLCMILKPGFHIVVSVVSVVRKKFIGQIYITLWKPPVQMLNTKETTDRYNFLYEIE